MDHMHILDGLSKSANRDVRFFGMIIAVIFSNEQDEWKTHDLGFCSEGKKMLGTVLIVILILILLGALPTWPHSRNWGYAPSGGLGLIVLILLILLLLGRI